MYIHRKSKNRVIQTIHHLSRDIKPTGLFYAFLKNLNPTTRLVNAWGISNDAQKKNPIQHDVKFPVPNADSYA